MQSRQSRMEKYYDNNTDVNDDNVASLRTDKNKDLYKEVNTLELKDFDLNNNVSVIGENTDYINLEDIQDILDEKYRENPRRKLIGDTEEIELPKINLDETREYDLNAILEKVKEQKEVNYEEERLKKVTKSQYDIFKDLDSLNEEEEIEEEIIDTDIADEHLESDESYEELDNIIETTTNEVPSSKTERELLELIDTIVAKELVEDETEEISQDIDPLDLLSDLRGDEDDTKVIGAMSIEDEPNNTLDLNTNEIAIDDENEVQEETLDEETTTNVIDFIPEDEDKTIEDIPILSENAKDNKNVINNSFITDSIKFNEEDFDDLKEKNGIGKILLCILLVIVIVAIIAGCIILFKNFL